MAVWALCLWFEEHGVEAIHPDDLDALRLLKPSGKVFRLVESQADYCVLEYGSVTYRVRPDLVRELDYGPIHSVGDDVMVADGTPATVRGVFWHHKTARPFYTLRIAGKARTRRYLPEDIGSGEAR